jgi:predicted Rossmann fold flavoprotein
MKIDVIIIGAGAAGLMCATQAAERGLEVLLLEANTKIGKKILISGGGKCNFTNRVCTAQNFLTKNKHFTKSALSRYSSQDFLDLIEENSIDYTERRWGQLFCTTSANDIVQMFQKKCQHHKVELKLSCKVLNIVKEEDYFIVTTSQSDFKCAQVVIATGGLSVPSIGANDFGFKIARQYGHKIIQTRAGLVGLIFDQSKYPWAGKFSGISMNVIVSADKQSFEENILFTHKGLSGPSILQISNYIEKSGFTINFLPQTKLLQELEIAKNKSGKKKLSNFLSQFLPSRFAKEWPVFHGVKDKNLADLTKKDILFLSELINSYKLGPSTTEGYRKAEVTIGGIDTAKISSKTMESSLVSGLYFIGEVLDVTGQLGGFNFQWAWSSAYACAMELRNADF